MLETPPNEELLSERESLERATALRETILEMLQSPDLEEDILGVAIFGSFARFYLGKQTQLNPRSELDCFWITTDPQLSIARSAGRLIREGMRARGQHIPPVDEWDGILVDPSQPFLPQVLADLPRTPLVGEYYNSADPEIYVISVDDIHQDK